jgi:hypothetical protein
MQRRTLYRSKDKYHLSLQIHPDIQNRRSFLTLLLLAGDLWPLIASQKDPLIVIERSEYHLYV